MLPTIILLKAEQDILVPGKRSVSKPCEGGKL